MSLAIVGVLITLTLFFLRDFNLIWTKVTPESAKVTINFLIPMDQEVFESKIKIEHSKWYDTQVLVDVSWQGPHTCIIELKEKGFIKGQEMRLIIENAPTKYRGVSKTVSIPIQFQTEVKLLEANQSRLITTHKPFYIQFNTPMNSNTLERYLQSDALFTIQPATRTNEKGEVFKDLSLFELTPKIKLENGRKYVLSFRKGMSAQSGQLLKNDVKIVVTTDQAPEILEVTPSNNSHWVGLYPRITVRSKEKIKNAYLEIDDEILSGELKNDYEAIFYPPYVLGAEREYTAYLQIEALSGEVSDKKSYTFKTVPLKEGRLWAEVILENQEIRIYNGTEEIKRMPCSTGKAQTPTSKGTYYVLEKRDSYFDAVHQEGANYWFVLSEGITIHGMSRNPYWTLNSDVYKRIGTPQTTGKIILKEEDALWLYEHLPRESMVIIHP